MWGLVITVLSLLPGKTLPRLNWLDGVGTDKVAHFGVYAVWAAFFVLTLTKEPFLPSRKIGVAVTAISLFGILMELLQWQLSPGRYFEWLDAIANALGALCGSLVTIKILKRSGSWN